MADETEHSTFKLDLDAKDFLETSAKAAESIKNIGNTDAIGALIEGLGTAGLVLGSFGLALYAIKETIDVVFDAEHIRQTQLQFENLSESAGVYHESLLKGLKEASAGWIDDVTLMKSANKALAELEVGAEKLPDLMDLARRSSMVMGGDVSENFDKISRAVATGSTRQLRHLGLIVDQQKAYRDYAALIGTTVDALNLAGRQQAVLNAVLEQGHEKFNEQGEDVRKSIGLWAQTKATLTDIGDVIKLDFEKVAGPAVGNFFKNLKALADDAKVYIQDKFGSGAEQSAAHLDRVKARILAIKGELVDLDQKKLNGMANAFDASKVVAFEAELKKLQADLPKTQAIVAKNAEEEKKKSDEVAAHKDVVRTVDLEKEKKQRAEAAATISKLDGELLKEEMKTMSSLSQATDLYQQKLKAQGAAVQAEIDTVKAKAATGVLTQAQADAQIDRLEKLKIARMRADERDLDQEKNKALDYYLAHATSSYDGVARAFQVSAQKSKIAMADFGKFGASTAKTFQDATVKAFSNIGSGAQSVADAMKQMFLSSIGSVAAKQGEAMFLASFETWPAWPTPKTAGGLALIALGGALGAAGGGGASISGSSAGGSTQASATAAAGASPGAPQGAATASTSPGKSVSIVIQGHMLMQDQTSRWLVDQIRAASDATDFRVQNSTGSAL